jgi:hypothetical protein
MPGTTRCSCTYRAGIVMVLMVEWLKPLGDMTSRSVGEDDRVVVEVGGVSEWLW